MASKLIIRKFLSSDIGKIIEIEKASFDKGAYSRRRLQNLAQNYPNDFLVALLADDIVGYIIAYQKARVVYFDSLAVAKEHRHQGIGKKLVKYVLKKFRKKGIKEASLEVRKSNKKAIAFYRNMGFKTNRVIKDYYRDGEDGYLMHLTDSK